MPRKRENNSLPLPGFDIFERTLPQTDRGLLLRPHYRRKQLAGFVPLWNEFFRCYHLAGVEPTAAYLWAYLRQYEHERREWNAVSDISWPGRRDLAEALGVSISHLPNLLNQLRQAGLLSFQGVLPGFEDLAEALTSTTEVVRDRAAEYGVTPKIDATLYRTSDPFTKTEFATMTKLKFCKGCKIYRYCEGAREANARLANNRETQAVATRPTPAITRQVKKPLLDAPALERQFELESSQRIEGNIERTVEETPGVSKKVQPPILNRVGGRLPDDSHGVSKEVRPVNLSRIKTNKHEPTGLNQPEITTTMSSISTLPKRSINPKALQRQSEKELVVDMSGREKVEQGLEYISPEPGLAGLTLLLQFGFDRHTATQLLQKATDYDKEPGYIQRILRYAAESARQNPQGMARRLIERGEERLSRADRWQQQILFEVGGSETVDDTHPTSSQSVEADIGPNEVDDRQGSPLQTDNIGLPDFEAEKSPPQPALSIEAANSSLSHSQTQIAQAYNFSREEVEWWNGVVEGLALSGSQVASSFFRGGVGVRFGAGRLVVVLRNLFDQRRAAVYSSQLERAIVDYSGQLLRLEFISFGQSL